MKQRTFGEYIAEVETALDKAGKRGIETNIDAKASDRVINPKKLQPGDPMNLVEPSGETEIVHVDREPISNNQVKIQKDNNQIQDVSYRDLSPLDDEQIQQEIERLRQLSGIGGKGANLLSTQQTDMGESDESDDESADELDEMGTGGATTAGAMATAVNRVNPVKRQHSPYGKAYKQARSKTSEYKRTPHKRGKRRD